MSNILVLGCGTQGLAMVKDIKKAGHAVFLIGGKHNYADMSRYVDKKQYCIDNLTISDYLATIKTFVEKNQIDVIIPMGDGDAEFLSKYKDELNSRSRFIMPNYNDFIRATDKNQLMALCKEKNYPHPFTINTVSDVKAIDRRTIPFPLLIKPNITCGARGMTLVHSYEELCEIFPLIQAEYGDCHLQQYVKQGGAQVEVQLFVDVRSL